MVSFMGGLITAKGDVRWGERGALNHNVIDRKISRNTNRIVRHKMDQYTCTRIADDRITKWTDSVINDKCTSLSVHFIHGGRMRELVMVTEQKTKKSK